MRPSPQVKQLASRNSDWNQRPCARPRQCRRYRNGEQQLQEMQDLLEAVNHHATTVDMSMNALRTKIMSVPIPWCCSPGIHFTHEAQRLRANGGTAPPPLPYKYTGTARSKKVSLIWSRCDASRWRADQGLTSAHIASHVAQANWRPAEAVSNTTKVDLDASLGCESLATHDGERTR